MASQYVGIDLHRRCLVIVRQNAAGEVLERVRIDNDQRAPPLLRPPKLAPCHRTYEVGSSSGFCG